MILSSIFNRLHSQSYTLFLAALLAAFPGARALGGSSGEESGNQSANERSSELKSPTTDKASSELKSPTTDKAASELKSPTTDKATSDFVNPIPKKRIYLNNLAAFRFVPVGPEDRFQLFFQRRLMDSESVLFQDTFVNGSLGFKLNPAFLKLGIMADIQPLAVFNLRVGYEWVGYFGAFGFLQAYERLPGVEVFDDDGRDARTDQAYATAGNHLFVEPTFQIIVGKIALRSKTTLEYWKVRLEGDDEFFYSPDYDIPLANGSVMVVNDTALVYVSGGKLNGGLVFTGIWPRLSEEALAEGEEPDLDYRSLRLGPLLTYSFNMKQYTRFSQPTIAIVTGFYMVHPWRVGHFPFVAIAFAVKSDLLNPRK